MQPISVPQRTCIGCRRRDDRSRLLRVVAGANDGELIVVVPDPGARLAGRGAWLHPVRQCLALGERRKAFGRALRVQGAVDVSAVSTYLEHREHVVHAVEHESGSESDGSPMSSLQ